jgi:hypothetical protein
LIITNCAHKQTGTDENPSVRTITVQSSDMTIKEEMPDFLELDSYIILSNELPLGEISRIIIHNDRIFILDNTPKIVCFDMRGKMIYQIDNRGPGPKEYDNIRDICIDKKSETLVAFDNQKRKIMIYDIKTGKYISDISTHYSAASGLAGVDETFFFHNPDHSRFEIQKDQTFFLLYSQTGKQIDSCFLPHNAISDFDFLFFPFFYSENKLLYNNFFEGTVYQLKQNEIIPLYDIRLPEMLPMAEIDRKIRHHDLVGSDYAYGLTDIYEAGKIIYFCFAKSGFAVCNFYDLEKDRLLYSGRIWTLSETRKNLPFYSLIKGVYKGKFFSTVSAMHIMEGMEKYPDRFPKELHKLKFDDNDIIAFYKIRN